MCGGAFLSYEGAHKIVHALKGDDHEHAVPAAALGPEAEKATIAGAIRTDLILSAEIMVISLKEVIDEPLVSRAVILVVVAFLITVVVYGVVAGIVKMDDVGLSLTQRASARAQAIGRRPVTAMPVLLPALSTHAIATTPWVRGTSPPGRAHEPDREPPSAPVPAPEGPVATPPAYPRPASSSTTTT